MAQTLIGTLLLRLQENVSAGAKKVTNSLKGIDAAARNIGSSSGGAAKLKGQLDGLASAAQKVASAPWGANIQSQFARLGASAKELEKIRAEWDRLQARIASGGLTGKLRSNELASWRQASIAHLTAVRAQMKTTESQAHALQRAMTNAMKPIGYAAGVGTSAYAGGRLGRAALASDATVERERFRMTASGFDPGQAKMIEAKAQDLAKTYGLFTGEVMEMMREASLAIPNLRDGNGQVIKTGFQSAMQLSEAITQFGVIMGNIHGQERASELSRAMMKSFDVLGINDPAMMRKAMDNYAKVNRVIGKDTDPSQLFLAAKYMRSPGKAFDPDFIYRMGAAMQAESSGSDVGTSLRAFFSNTAGEKRSKKSQKMLGEYGLTEADGTIKGADLMTNPGLWVESVLKPALEAKGVDTKQSVKVAQILSQLFDNRLSADVAQKFLEQIEQYRDVLARADNAHGLDKAKDVRQGDPFAAYESFTKSLQNLAAASNVTATISPALNSLADGINSLGSALKGMSEADLATAGIVGGLLALKGAMVAGGGLAALIGAGPALSSAAVALHSAAAALGAKGALPGVRGAPAGSSQGGSMAATIGAVLSRIPAGAATLGAALSPFALRASRDEALKNVPGATLEEKIANQRAYQRAQLRKNTLQSREESLAREGYDATGNRLVKPGEIYSRGQRDSNTSTFSSPRVDTSDLDAAKDKAAEAGQQIQSLNVTAKPNVDTTAISTAQQMADKLLQTLQAIGGAGAAAGASIGSRVRAAQSDFGVAP